jgi:hypothetical protein
VLFTASDVRKWWLMVLRLLTTLQAIGGGAAVLYPNKPSSIVNTMFLRNAAHLNAEVVQTLLAQNVVSSEVAGWLQEQQRGVRLGDTTTNPLLGDAGYYSGGAGLYLAVTQQFILTGCGFAHNNGSSGGELFIAIFAGQPQYTQVVAATFDSVPGICCQQMI